MTFLRSVIPHSLWLIGQDLRANAFGVCGRGKPSHLFRSILQPTLRPMRDGAVGERLARRRALRRNYFRLRVKSGHSITATTAAPLGALYRRVPEGPVP